ncbi:MAG: CotH kinase family protein [Clostridiales bacterium]|nr:CotH kinase family protein [Clostridiales bacterium]
MNTSFKRFCAAFAVLALLAGGFTYSPLEREAAAAAKEFTLYIGNADTTDRNSLNKMPAQLISASRTGTGLLHFFIPADWDAARLRIFIDGRDSLIIENKTYENGAQLSLPLDKKLTLRVDKGGTRYTLTVLKISALPNLFIETESGSTEYIDKSKQNKEAAVMLMVDPDGRVEYDGKLKYIRIRGNSTAAYNKKPYQIKLEKKTSLCGMEADKTWILLANYVDKSQLRNTVALAMARYSGAYSYVPDSQFVGVYVNHEYKGLYLLTEKAEIGTNRLNITDLEDELEKLNPNIDLADTPGKSEKGTQRDARKYHVIPNEPEDVTGGYLVTGNREARYEGEESGFVTSRRYYFTLQQPKYATKNEIDYISTLFQSIEDALFSSDGKDPITGKHYTELVDLNSYVHRYLQLEITDDFDIQMIYLYKDKDSVDSKVYFGPVWDQDYILGVRSTRSSPRLLRLPDSKTDTWYWLTIGMKHSDFKKAAKQAYTTIYTKALDILLGNAKDSQGRIRSIDQYASQISDSGRADLIIYPVAQRDRVGKMHDTGSSFNDNVNYLKNYVKQRKVALDKAYLLK